MDVTLSILATIALLASTLVTLVLTGGTKGFTLRTPSGPDAMGIVVVFIASLIAWALTLLGAIIVACRGAFAWLATPVAAAGIVLVPIVVALTFLSFMALAASLENRLKLRTLYGWLGALVLPLAVNAFGLFLAWVDPALAARSSALRIAAIPLGLVAAASVVFAIWLYLNSQAKAARRMAQRIVEDQEREERNRAAALERDAAHKAELDALPDDAPLATFATHLFIDKSQEHHKRALARIGSLPDLAARFDRELNDPDPLAREYLLNYFGVAPSLDPSLTAALTPTIARCFEHLARDLAWLANDATHRAHGHARGMTLGLLHAASRFPARFTQPARVLREAFDAWPNPSTREAAQELLDSYLTNRPLPE